MLDGRKPVNLSFTSNNVSYKPGRGRLQRLFIYMQLPARVSGSQPWKHSHWNANDVPHNSNRWSSRETKALILWVKQRTSKQGRKSERRSTLACVADALNLLYIRIHRLQIDQHCRFANFAFSFVLDRILAWIWNEKRQNFRYIFENAMMLNVLNYRSAADRCMRRRDLPWKMKFQAEESWCQGKTARG